MAEVLALQREVSAIPFEMHVPKDTSSCLRTQYVSKAASRGQQLDL